MSKISRGGSVTSQLRIQDFSLGAPTSDTGAFRQKRMQKQKNWVPGGAGGFPLDPPLFPVGELPTPFGGADHRCGCFWRKCMRKRKNWVPLVGAAVPLRSANDWY